MTNEASRGRLSRWWDAISHHPLWAAVIATLLAATIVAHSGGVFSDAGTSPESPSRNVRGEDGQPLRVVWTPEAPQNFAVLFNRYIPVPRESEAWQGLHARGGVDVTLSKFRLTLANTSNVPITITDVEAIITAAQPRPVGSEARVYTQGTEGLEEFGVLLRDTTPGSRSAFHHTPHGEVVEDAETGPPFFTNHDISLAPSQIYEAKVAVQIEVSREVEYGFIIRGNTARRSFTDRPRARFRIVGFNPHLFEVAHLYWQLPRRSGSSCWIHAYNAKYEPACP
jgi:hypothetical protein